MTLHGVLGVAIGAAVYAVTVAVSADQRLDFLEKERAEMRQRIIALERIHDDTLGLVIRCCPR